MTISLHCRKDKTNTPYSSASELVAYLRGGWSYGLANYLVDSSDESGEIVSCLEASDFLHQYDVAQPAPVVAPRKDNRKARQHQYTGVIMGHGSPFTGTLPDVVEYLSLKVTGFPAYLSVYRALRKLNTFAGGFFVCSLGASAVVYIQRN